MPQLPVSKSAELAVFDERLVKIVLSLMEENVWRQKILAMEDVKEKRRQVMDEFGVKQPNLQESYNGYTEED